mgnify:CR=1 FL=1
MASLQTGSGGHHPEVRELYEPTLSGFAPNAFGLHGFERIEHPQGAYGAVQEWHVEAPTNDEIMNAAKPSQGEVVQAVPPRPAT